MIIEAIVLSNSKNQRHYNITKNTIDTLRASKGWIGDIHVVETQSAQHLKNSKFDYKCDMIYPPCNFNYNRYLNYGVRGCDSPDWYLICNND